MTPKCEYCTNMIRCKVGNKVFSCCSVRKSDTSETGLLKLSINDKACDLFSPNDRFLEIINRTEIEYAHITPLSEFKPTIDKLKSLGFSPIAATILLCEDTYVFETKDEVDKACEAVPELGFGWVYDRVGFLEAVKEREEHLDGKKIFIHWLK